MRAPRFFEWQEQRWLPRYFRHGITHYLRKLFVGFNIYSPVAPLLAHLIKQTHRTKLWDFCSGSGGMLPEIQTSLRENHQIETDITFTDKFPNCDDLVALCKSAPESLHFKAEAIDALHHDQPTSAIRTFFTAFHHFNEKDATQILKSAVKSGDPIAIFEFTEHRWYRYCFDLIIPFHVLGGFLTTRPHSLKQLATSPALALMIFWDSLVSNIRTYSTKELQQMTAALPDNDYVWETGQVKAGLRFYKLTYLIGYRK
jgi:hypothetical protein